MQCHLLQLTSQHSPSHNFSRIEAFVQQLGAASHNALLVLPEACLHFGQGQPWHQDAEPSGSGYWQQRLAQLAKAHHCYLVAGTVPVQAADGRAYASSWLFGPDGTGLARYDKVHLFDAEVGDGSDYQESKHTHPGDRLVVVETAIGRIGMAVCYDVRFAAALSQLAAAEMDVLVLPSAFTARTGQAHWQPLLQARAIENQCFVVAANQWGSHGDGRQTWGQSMLIDPWGDIIAQRPTGEGWISAQLALERIPQLRANMPVLQHRRTVAVERIQEES
ncbi:carbon-nitrogen hydrolase family protein [uncultured Ferrimonas sp.]|uniref:carbon-nitrogen hydrolase family protein n=1 Tax=uncultured Ferrimonas sp. TaxID=432640 RepID=UPI002605A578|nr:carbon-nitrogen hydrolase family protein [uncultured Ferrimonas sp.]